MSVYGIVKTADGMLVTRRGQEPDGALTLLFGSFHKAVEHAESLGFNCMVVELVPRVNIRHECIRRTIIDPLL